MISSIELCEIIRTAGQAGVKQIRFNGIELDFHQQPIWDRNEDIVAINEPVVDPVENVVHNDNNEYEYTNTDLVEAGIDDLLTSDPVAFERLQLNDEE